MNRRSSKERSGDLAVAAGILWGIKRDPERLHHVLELQRYLVRSISRCERRIRYLRKARVRMKQLKAKGRRSREESRSLKDLGSGLDIRIKELQKQIYIWRCFGDGIAYIYQSKYALKHLLYDKNYKVKQGPGFISGKNGFRKEFKLLIAGIRMNVPVVLADVTNIIRHGDVCALGGEDPLPIEVKSSDNSNARVARQLGDLREIASFYANDWAENFRGAPNTTRAALLHKEINYEEEINACVEEAINSGFSTADPEEGLTYIAHAREFTEPLTERLEAKLATLAGRRLVFTHITPNLSWQPHYPFTLSLSPVNLIAFIEGRIEIAVLVDASVMKQKFAALGVHATGIMDGTHSFQICRDPSDLSRGVFRISEQLFSRIPLEFQSLDWFVKEHASAFEKASISGRVAPDSRYQVPESWKNAKCIFADPEGQNFN